MDNLTKYVRGIEAKVFLGNFSKSAHSSTVEHEAYTFVVLGSNPSARTSRLTITARKNVSTKL